MLRTEVCGPQLLLASKYITIFGVTLYMLLLQARVGVLMSKFGNRDASCRAENQHNAMRPSHIQMPLFTTAGMNVMSKICVDATGPEDATTPAADLGGFGH